ncbi:hypothetical protein HSX11_17685 [Oxalobacteraceae bacterium]|nr:hypothetical protein [Oxalobacteraceae bacterium]
MQIVQAPNTNSIVPGNAGNAVAADGTSLGTSGENAATATPVTPTPKPAAPLQRGLNNYNQPLQADISGAQQALDFLEQSAAQLRALKADLSAKLAASSQSSDGAIEARVRQFSSTWRSRSQASGGTLNATLNYTKAATQRFSVRGMTLGNLRHGGREVLAIAVGGSTQGLRSVVLEAGLTDEEIVQRFDQALAPADIRVGVNEDGELVFETPESNWSNVRDTIAVQGGGMRFPTGQMNRIKADAEAPMIAPDQWNTADAEALRQTLAQVVQALAQIEAAIAQVSVALSQASSQVQDAAPVDNAVGMDQAAQNFVTTTNQPGYQSLLSLTSALVGISRERVISLLGLR